MTAEGTCADCQPSCTDGCVNGDSCGLCDVEGCIICTEFGKCETCLLECDDPRVPDCNLEVCVCSDPNEFWWLDLEICLPFCATGFSPNSARHCEKSADLVLDISFTDFNSVIELFPHGILMTPSSQQTYTADPTGSPIPTKGRGVYYGSEAHRDDAYLVISGC